jgi:hypothetical protein
VQVQKQYIYLEESPVKIMHVAEAALVKKYSTDLFLGYTASLIGGLALATTLGRRTTGYRPNLLGQIGITVLTTFTGGAAVAATITPRFVTGLIATPYTQTGTLLCSGILQMRPCMQDANCRQLAGRGSGGKHLLKWYSVSAFSDSEAFPLNVDSVQSLMCYVEVAHVYSAVAQ